MKYVLCNRLYKFLDFYNCRNIYLVLFYSDMFRVYNKKKIKKKYSKLIEKYLTTKWILIVLLLLFLILLFSQAFKGILLLIVLVPLSKYTVRVTRFVNYITLETYTGSAILFGYIYGPMPGLLTGLFLGMYGYLSNSVTKFLALMNVFVSCITGFVVGYFSFMNFSTVFIYAILFNNLFASILFFFLDPDQLQNITYRITHVFWNIGIVRLIFIFIFDFYNLI